MGGNRINGIFPLAGTFEPESQAPFDGRLRVPSKSDLYILDTWIANDGGNYAYEGMPVAVYSDPNIANRGLYILESLDFTNVNNWRYVGKFNSNTSSIKARVFSTSNIDIVTGGLLVSDGVTLVDGDRVICFHQSTSIQDGIYVAHAGSWERTDDFPIGYKCSGDWFSVSEGTDFADTFWMITNDSGADIVGTDNLISTQLTGGGSDETAIHKNINAEISTITEKAVLVDDDLLIIEDSTDSFSKKRIKKSSIVSDAEKSTWNAKQDALGFTPENIANKGNVNGYAELDGTGKVPSSQLPSYVDDVLEFDNLASFPATGEASIIYIAKDTNFNYRWGGSSYIRLNEGVVLGETSSTAYRGDRGKIAYDYAVASHSVTENNDVTDAGSGSIITSEERTALGHTIHDNVAGEIDAVTEKANTVGNDKILLEDSADSNNKKSAKLINLPISSSVQAALDLKIDKSAYNGRVIYVDAVQGVNNTDLGRGNNLFPYKTLKYAEDSITDNVLDVVGDTTIGDATIGGFSDVDFELMEVGQRIIGTGIPSYAYITELTGGGSDNNSIEINEVCTVDSTDISITLLNKYLIKVMPGNYNPTETLGKESVSWYFEPNTKVERNDSLDFMFNGVFTDSTFKDGFDVFGYGDFKNNGIVLRYTMFQNGFKKNFTFECNSAISTQTTTLTVSIGGISDGNINIKANSVISSSSYAISINDFTPTNINVGIMKSTTTYAITSLIGFKNLRVNSNKIIGDTYGFNLKAIETSHVKATYCTGYYITGGDFSCSIVGDAGLVTFYGANVLLSLSLIGKYSTVNMNCTYGIYSPNATNLVGFINTLNINGGKLIGGEVRTLNLNGGYVQTSLYHHYFHATANLYGGGSDISLKSNTVTVNGFSGRHNIIFSEYSNLVVNTYTFNCNGATLTFKNDFISSKTTQSFNINSGKIIFQKCALKSNYLMYYNGGLIELDDVKLIGNTEIQIIRATTTGLNVHVLSGGVNANCGTGELLSAKKWKEKITVTSVATTSINIGTETFSESDTATYDTEILLAGRLTSLINASSTLDITATDNGDGTFDVESDTAGIPCSSSLLSNCTFELLRYNSYAITDITGGAIIENTAIDF